MCLPDSQLVSNPVFMQRAFSITSIILPNKNTVATIALKELQSDPLILVFSAGKHRSR